MDNNTPKNYLVYGAYLWGTNRVISNIVDTNLGEEWESIMGDDDSL
jgi:hypothetical protein